MTAADEGRLVYIVGAVSGVIEGALKHAFGIGPRKNVMEITSIDPIEPGDSGSVVVDKNGLLVGLIHRATVLTTLSHASHIGPVLDILRVTPITAANEPDNPAFSGTAAAQAMAPATSPTPGGMLRQRLSETENGRRIAASIQEHQSEVVHLVNHERAVTVAWHRNKGPQFFNEAAANAVNPETPGATGDRGNFAGSADSEYGEGVVRAWQRGNAGAVRTFGGVDAVPECQ